MLHRDDHRRQPISYEDCNIDADADANVNANATSAGPDAWELSAGINNITLPPFGQAGFDTSRTRALL